MSESAFVTQLIGTGIKFPLRKSQSLEVATELKVTQNRVDIVYFDRDENGKVANVIAVEAKLRDWKRALQQAFRNRLFADRVYVAIPSTFAAPAIKNIWQFRETSVGLIVWEGSQSKVYYHPPANKSASRWHAESVKRSLSSILAK